MIGGRLEVEQQAAEAWTSAPETCSAGCGWYHRVWPSLRALGLVATPDRHAAFFERGLAGAGRRILVSGAADAAMPEVVVAAVPDAELTVLDRCPTPVELARSWGARRGLTVHGLVADVLEQPGDGSFDAVATHGLFSLVTARRRSELARAWASWLRRDGVLVTTSSLSPPGTPDPSGFTSTAIDAFAERAAAAGASAEVVEAARAWAQRAEVHPVTSAEVAVGVLEEAGFDVDVAQRDVEGPLGRDESGPTSARSARYLEIVARRR